MADSRIPSITDPSGHTHYELPRQGTISESELEIKRSRFLTLITRVHNEEEAREFIATVKELYPDARHHCSAYIFHVDGSNPIERSSDDGEPSGTAGKPMLEVLRGSGLLDVAAVTVRYFGGIKLGTGGLVSAYTHAVSSTLIRVQRSQRAVREIYSVSFPHCDAGRIEANLRRMDVAIMDTDYGADVVFTLAVEPGKRHHVESLLSSLSGMDIIVKEIGQTWVETPIAS